MMNRHERRLKAALGRRDKRRKAEISAYEAEKRKRAQIKSVKNTPRRDYDAFFKGEA